MKINDVHRAGGILNYQQNVGSMQGTSASKKGQSKDSLQISDAAKELLEIQGTSNAGRSEKMMELKQAIQEGTYQVDAHKLAEKMLQYFKNPYGN